MAPDETPTIETQIRCVEREIAMRARVYPRWVAAKNMSQAKADSEIATMRAVLATLRNMATLDDPRS